MKSVTGIVTEVIEHGNTRNGNVRRSVVLATPTEGYAGNSTFRIADDSSLAIEIGNSEYADKPHIFELTRGGKLSGRVEEYPV